MVLKNRRRIWQFETSTWHNFPTEDESATIYHSSGLVLTMMNDDTVSLDVAIDSDEQYWGIGPVNDEGYFTIQNESGKFLTAASITTTLVTGKLDQGRFKIWTEHTIKLQRMKYSSWHKELLC